MLTVARGLEDESVADYNKWANLAASYSDSGTKTLFEGIIKEEEAHYDIFDTELDNLATFRGLLPVLASHRPQQSFRKLQFRLARGLKISSNI